MNPKAQKAVRRAFDIYKNCQAEIDSLKEEQEEAMIELESYGFTRRSVSRVVTRLKYSKEENEEMDDEIARLEDCLPDSHFGSSDDDDL